MTKTDNKNKSKFRKPSKKILILAIVCTFYLVLALMYSLWTPAWEANDEADHTIYAERIVAYHHIPHISLANGHESHQPPLYYIALAGWQKILSIPVFEPDPIPVAGGEALGPSTQPKLGLSHNYNSRLKQEAVWVHELRVLSILFGLGTVIFTFLVANALTKKINFSVAATLFVVLLPKQLVINSVVTNDSLVVMLCSLLLYLAVKCCTAEDKRLRLYSFLMGATAGAATLTKLNSLPLSILFFAILACFLYKKEKHFLSGTALYAGGFMLLCAWWLLYNWKMYGDPIAQAASNNYLEAAIPGLIKPVSWFNTQRFIHFLPSELHSTAWYDGGWNQLILPGWVNTSLWALAFISFVGVGVYMRKYVRHWYSGEWWRALFLVTAVATGLLTTYIIARTTVQAEGRVAYIGLSAFAIFCTVGLATVLARVSIHLNNAGLFLWPAILALVNVYVLLHILIPLHAL
ncbi:MAG TPA: hypothetical protein VFH99_03375 [Candidatus Saccharimonadales bacterium]|nr:hypothetical protein [Candidatus Saccharimonadales bacterium]